MDDINKDLGAAGAGVTTTLGGQEYTLSPLTQGLKAKFSEWVAQRAREAALEGEKFYRTKARALRKQLEEDGDAMDDSQREDSIQEIRDLEASAREQMSEYNANRTAGKFHFTDVYCSMTLGTAEGSIKITQLMLRKAHPDLTFEKVSELFEKYQKELRQGIKEVQGLGKSKPSPEPDGGPPAPSE